MISSLRTYGPGIAAVVLSLAAAAPAARGQGYLYVGDFSGNQVVRFDAATGAPVSPTPYIKLSGAEGIGGTNTILIVGSSNGFINEYNTSTGAAQNPPLLLHINTPGFSPLRVAMSLNGEDFYVAGNSSNGQIREYNTATGALVHSINTPGGDGSWGVAVNPTNGYVYFTSNWNGTGPNRGAVFSADPNLSAGSLTTVAAPGAHGATDLVGIAFRSDGSFYVVNGGNGDPNNDFIIHYNANGTFRDFVNTTGMPAGALYNAFDTEVGPGGHLYVSSQNGACVVDFNPNDTYNSILVPAHAGGLDQAKTIHFSINNVPEPSSLALAGLGTVGTLGYTLRRRRRLRTA